MILNITHNGKTTEHTLILVDVDLDDAYVRHLAEEIREMPRGTLDGFIVDRMATGDPSVSRLYVRPKVPFGSERIGDGPGILEVYNVTQGPRLEAQLAIAVDALLKYSTSATCGDRARIALEAIAALDQVQ